MSDEPDVTVTLTYREAIGIGTLCRMQAERYGLTEGYVPVDVAEKLGRAINEARRSATPSNHAPKEER